MAAPMTTHFRALDAMEIGDVLRRNAVGRLAFRDGERTIVLPVQYVYSAGGIYGRTSPGEKMTALARDPGVAFEVDEIEGPYDWCSVLVQGNFEVLSPTGDAWKEALRLLRGGFLEVLSEEDPAPFRTVLFRIVIREATGREATSRGSGE